MAPAGSSSPVCPAESAHTCPATAGRHLSCYGWATRATQLARSDTTDVVGTVALVTGLGPGDDLDAITIAAPAATHLVELLLEDLEALHLRRTGQIHVPELAGARPTYDVEAGQVAAVTAAPPVALVRDREGHAPTLNSSTQHGTPRVSVEAAVGPRA